MKKIVPIVGYNAEGIYGKMVNGTFKRSYGNVLPRKKRCPNRAKKLEEANSRA